ncbi:MAG: hypothetical protein AB8G17_03235 [Gammaproteobacteria bacterium]
MPSHQNNLRQCRRPLTAFAALCAVVLSQFVFAAHEHLGDEPHEECAVCCIGNLDEGTTPVTAAPARIVTTGIVENRVEITRPVRHQQLFLARAPPRHLKD